MFHKIRFRLTILSGSITTLILIAMTMCYLYVSEKTLMQSWVLSWKMIYLQSLSTWNSR